MKIELIHKKGVSIAKIISDKKIINTPQDALDLMAECNYSGTSKILIHEENIIGDFFDLKTGIAGEILQKFSTYRCELAIIGNFTKYTSKSLKDFITESNRIGRIIFVKDVDAALNLLAKN